jgi:hypothetical protein
MRPLKSYSPTYNPPRKGLNDPRSTGQSLPSSARSGLVDPRSTR